MTFDRKLQAIPKAALEQNVIFLFPTRKAIGALKTHTNLGLLRFGATVYCHSRADCNINFTYNVAFLDSRICVQGQV